MRPEIQEYNYDWLLGGLLESAANIANASPKEIELMYRYIPNFKGMAQSFIDAGPPGIAFHAYTMITMMKIILKLSLMIFGAAVARKILSR